MLRFHIKFYNKFPDMSARTLITGLTPSHYAKLAQRDLTKEEIEKYEEKASEEKLSVRELEETVATSRW